MLDRTDATGFTDDIDFTDPDREAAEAAARELFRLLRSLGVELDDMTVVAPCDTCRRSGHRVHLGTLHVEDVRTLVTELSILVRRPRP
ncbi:hypothetical protein [Streptomyces spiramenti]|uniref:Uncharacterized protein n=1 Tax=Streptomyces spiramenti TaxID=2720606 RepID=A0ABX1AEZ3_9ACTN|nr:hypothetical protein [Streptomyces spiramenti]NJP65684.1 hypothetical protein [Streptomyces spiramenti]